MLSSVFNRAIMRHLEIAIQASVKAGDEILKIYNGEHAIEYKADKSPLTEADKNANHVINGYLQQTTIPIISEENKQISYDERKKWNECWIVDPLDGTREFIKRNGEFTVNIALVKNQKPVLGVIYVPVTRELYFGIADKQKAFKIIVDDNENISVLIGKAIQINPAKKDVEKIRIAGSRSHMNDETSNFIEGLKAEYKEIEMISKGSSLKFCLMAEGKADVYPRFAPTMEWDTAAGQAICEAAELKVISKETGDSLLYNKENLFNPSFLVTKNNI
ncbi:MAG: 3'(2'),5'-bisphosphate nucleotidase CysQ [Ginsengibacter sp.]